MPNAAQWCGSALSQSQTGMLPYQLSDVKLDDYCTVHSNEFN